MGVTSLMVDYLQLTAAYLVRALNDKGPLGWTTRGMLQQQHTQLGGLQTMHLHSATKKLERQAGRFHILR